MTYALLAVAAWLRERPTPIYWISGPPGSAKSAVARAALIDAALDRCEFLLLDAIGVDRALRQLLRPQDRPERPATTAELVELVSAGTYGAIVLDGFDVVQDDQSQITDFRFRNLMTELARKGCATAVIVTSRLVPPQELPDEAVTRLEMPSPTAMAQWDLEFAPASPSMLEIIASSRQAVSGWLLGFVAGLSKVPSLATPAAVRDELRIPLESGLIRRIAWDEGEWFQMVDAARTVVVAPQSERWFDVHAQMAAALSSEDLLPYVELSSDPDLHRALLERSISHRLALGDTESAIVCYWNLIGNFSALRHEWAFHFGARVCRTLNGGGTPDNVGRERQNWRGTAAFVNDWSQYTICVGDGRAALAAARSAFSIAQDRAEPSEKATLACHVADAMLLTGDLREARSWADRARYHATEGLRANNGMATVDVMEAYDDACAVTIRIMERSLDRRGAEAALKELVEVHTRSRKALADFNRRSTIPIEGPSGPVDSEKLLNGSVAGRVAILHGRLDEARRIIETSLADGTSNRLDSDRGLWLRVLLLTIRKDWGEEARSLLARLVELARKCDDTAARCELAAIAARIALHDGGAMDALSILDDHLSLAAVGGLKTHWIDLLTIRSSVLLTLCRREEAQAMATAALFGPSRVPAVIGQWPACADLNGASHDDWADRKGVLAAIRALEASGGLIPEEAKAVVGQSVESLEQSGKTVSRVAAEPRVGEAERRAQLHQAALAVIDDYNLRGVPFALYFRNFDISVMHGPMEFGPRLIENVLYEAIPAQANFLTIQSEDTGFASYSGDGTHFDRFGPALLLDDKEWRKTAAELIAHADLIVSECYFLTDGVRFELQSAYDAKRWDRTVLLLPPLDAPISPVDSDPLVQMFPHCIWADAFHTRGLPDHGVLKNLIGRLGEIGALSEEARRAFASPHDRDAACPVDLLRIALECEAELQAGLWSHKQDRNSRYYGFWSLFRACSIRTVLMQRGDDSFDNRYRLADQFIQMGNIMFDSDTEGDRIVLLGDMTFAKQCASSAFHLMRAGDPWFASGMRDAAERNYNKVMLLRREIEADPDRFVMRPRYGPVVVHAGAAKQLK